ncbi:MAG: helix-turn-helix domain-containing protein [Eubacteriales bacterium]|nr:helix-turn-helix domain-containing protein [Eubacteriales bacterium]
MNLSAKLVVFYLRRHLSLRTSAKISAEPCLKYPVLYQKGLPLREQLIYVIDEADFLLSRHNLNRVLLLLTGKYADKTLEKYPNVCLIESEASAAWILQLLQEIFQIYNEWQQEIFKLMSSASSVQRILDISSEAIHNPMTVIGMDFTVIGSVGMQMDNLKDSVFGSSEETLPIVNALKNDPNYENAVRKRGFFYYPGNEYASPSLCVNIQSCGRTAYRLLISAGSMPLDNTIGFLAEFLAQNVTILINSSMFVSKGDQSLRYIFHNLLTNPKADYVEISQELTAYGWQVTHYYLCILIQIGTPDWKNLTLKAICSYIENTVPESCAVEHEGNIVVYINLNLVSLPLDHINQKLACFIRDNYLTAGYSRQMMGHFNFYRQYQQAKLTIDLGRRRHPTAWIHHFNDIAMTYYMEQLTKKLPAYMTCHEQLLQLKYQDEATGSELYRTLRCYLQNQQSATKTAQAMYIHRSTLLYRLNRIRDIMKSDFSDPEEVLYLLLSFRLLEEEENQTSR